ncbi:hypothetical protein MTO96_005335 [Rhipicephalus appendiculatus]
MREGDARTLCRCDRSNLSCRAEDLRDEMLVPAVRLLAAHSSRLTGDSESVGRGHIGSPSEALADKNRAVEVVVAVAKANAAARRAAINPD